MLVNTHAHFFNLRLINTARMRETLVNRLISDGWPDYIVKLIQKVVDESLDDDHIDEEKILKKLVRALKADERFKEVVTTAFDGILPDNIGFIIHGDTDGATVYSLQKALNKICQRLSEKDDIGKSDFDDILGFLLLMLKPSMEAVADSYFDYTPAGHTAVALMMDITKDGDDDAKRFEEQTTATSNLTLSYPGQILPFYAINPLRPEPLQRLKKAVDLGFVGVKLYPSLGYDPFSAEMKEVYAYCAEKELPIMTHCNQGGFNFREEDIQLAGPEGWTSILSSLPKLKICFGHFGGAENLSAASTTDQIGSWTRTILDLMRAHEGVYADISYHTDPMDGGDAEVNYFNNLKALLSDDICSKRILWGTDYTLVRQRAREENYWAYFKRLLSEQEFKQISEINPQTYLGLPDEDGANAKENILRHTNFIHQYEWAVERMPSEWIAHTLREQGITPDFIVNPFGPSYNPKNRAHASARYALMMVICDDGNPIQRYSFFKQGSMRLRELPRWPHEALSANYRQVAFESLAAQLNKDLTISLANRGYGAKRKTGVTYDAALRKIEAQLKDGKTTVAEFVAVIDQLYTFPNIPA